MRRLSLLVLFVTLFAMVSNPSPAAAQESPEGLVTVSGEATVSARPDEAVVRLGIQEEASEASDAQLGANRVAAAILEAVAGLDVPAEAVRTSQLQLHPIYESMRPRGEQYERPSIVGYRAVNTVSVTLSDLEKIGPVIDRSIAAGANRIDGVDLRLEDDTEAKRKALAAAVADARGKAEVIAEALGERLGSIVEVNEGGVSAPPIVYREAAMARSADAGTPVATGSLSVRASVTLRYRLEAGE